MKTEGEEGGEQESRPPTVNQGATINTKTTALTVTSALPDEHPWRTEGLFSPHYLAHRLPGPHSPLWPEAAEANAVFEAASARFAQYHAALLTASEEE